MDARRALILVLAVFVLIVAACGGDDDDDSTTESETETGEPAAAATDDDGGDDAAEDVEPAAESGDDNAESAEPEAEAEEAGGGMPAAPAVGEMGSFEVNGSEFAVTFLNRCVPFAGPDSGIIDLQPIAQGQGAQLNLYGDGGAGDEVSVQGSTIQEMFGSIAFSTLEAEESNLEGDRWSGSATLEDALDVEDPVQVTWDVMVPPDAQEC